MNRLHHNRQHIFFFISVLPTTDRAQPIDINLLDIPINLHSAFFTYSFYSMNKSNILSEEEWTTLNQILNLGTPEPISFVIVVFYFFFFICHYNSPHLLPFFHFELFSESCSPSSLLNLLGHHSLVWSSVNLLVAIGFQSISIIMEKESIEQGRLDESLGSSQCPKEEYFNGDDSFF
ncbi:hypothetical protein C0J52_13652 [Blattella germanica]|nr:hypothetical protein C0J52_13652 [Blattella germanica]